MCVCGQIAMMFEFFISLFIVSAIGGYVVKSYLTPLASVRFSRGTRASHRERTSSDRAPRDVPRPCPAHMPTRPRTPHPANGYTPSASSVGQLTPRMLHTSA
jgi:hypothetical protein